MKLTTSPTGEYRNADNCADEAKLERYVNYIEWRYGSDKEDVDLEEIDVDATNPAEARAICEAVLERDYEPGGKIIEVKHIPRGMMYL